MGLIDQDNMIQITGGKFTMGATPDQEDESFQFDEERPHKTIVHEFLVNKYQVTQELWSEVIGFNPSISKGPRKPVHSINWYEAVLFCNKLSLIENLEPFYDIHDEYKDPFNYQSSDKIKWDVVLNHTNGYRLLSEAEWEYAARGANKSECFLYSGSNDLDEVGWYNENSDNEPHDVGLKKANELGLHDMSGNIEEMCWNWFEYERVDHDKDPFTDFVLPIMGQARIFKGGSWATSCIRCRPAFRGRCVPSLKFLFFGMRIARSLIDTRFIKRIG